MIKFDNVTKKFPDGTLAAYKVDLEIDKDEFVFLVGPSGAGKTTILRLLTRELVPTEGTIIIDNQNIIKIPESKIHLLRRRIGTIFQDYKLLTDRTVWENVAISLEVLGQAEGQIKHQVKEVLGLVGLTGKENLFPQQLSGGELQRTTIARAVVGDPEIILADEPTADLDPANAWEIIHLLAKINKNGTVVIMATHNMDVVNSLKKRVIHIDDGKITKDEKKGKYASG
ncbi:MAG TPA: cell division ATP-binding protein FtsE [Patescibacteria group bacterium]